MSGELDFLELDPNREAQKRLAIDEAQLYLVFESDPRAQQILANWSERLMHKRTSVNAPHAEYVWNEALRDFIAGIYRQIALAKSGDHILS